MDTVNRRNVLAILFLVLITVGFGCKPEPNPEPTFERSYLHILSAAQAVSDYDLTFDYYNSDAMVIGDFSYRRNWPLGGYADLRAAGTPDQFGNGKLWLTASSQPFINVAPDTVMQPTAFVMGPNQYQTIAFVDSAGTLAMTVFEDVFDTPSNGANLRLMNLKDGSGNVQLRSTDGSIGVLNVPYRTASPFVQVPSGTYDMEIADESGATVLASWAGLTIGNGVTYTIYLSGTSTGDLGIYTH